MGVLALVFVVVLVIGGAMLSTSRKREVRQIERAVERRREVEAALETWSLSRWRGDEHQAFDVNFRNMVFAEEWSSRGGGVARTWGALRRVDGARWERREDADSSAARFAKLKRGAESGDEVDAAIFEDLSADMLKPPTWCALEDDLGAKLEAAYQAFRRA